MLGHQGAVTSVHVSICSEIWGDSHELSGCHLLKNASPQISLAKL
jgi:hypothetical protein